MENKNVPDVLVQNMDVDILVVNTVITIEA